MTTLCPRHARVSESRDRNLRTSLRVRKKTPIKFVLDNERHSYTLIWKLCLLLTAGVHLHDCLVAVLCGSRTPGLRDRTLETAWPGHDERNATPDTSLVFQSRAFIPASSCIRGTVQGSKISQSDLKCHNLIWVQCITAGNQYIYLVQFISV